MFSICTVGRKIKTILLSQLQPCHCEINLKTIKRKKNYQLKNNIDIAYCHTIKLKNGKKTRDLGHKYKMKKTLDAVIRQ